MRRAIAVCGIFAAVVAAPAGLASSLKPTKAWKGQVKLFETPITVLEFPGGGIEVEFTPVCSFSGRSINVKTVAHGHLSGSHFTIASATVPRSISVSEVKITGTIGRTSITGSTKALYAKGGDTCNFQPETFKAARLKTVPKGF
jgi:hypothetical protein